MTTDAMYTIGHSTRTLADFLRLLEENRIALVVDVRRFPGSRRHPHFSRSALASALEPAGIEYRHEGDLGGRREPRSDSPNTAWRVAGFRGYADYMATPAFASALGRLAAEARRSPTAILCAEAVPWRCHRQLIADALVTQGLDVIHILGPGQTRRHELHPAARLEDGVLVYAGRG